MLPYYLMFQEEDHLAGLYAASTVVSYSKKEKILRSYAGYETLYIVKDGVVRSFYTDEKGVELTVNLLKPRAIFPLSGYLSGKENLYDFEAFTDTTLYKAPKEKVKKLIYKNATLSSYYLERFAQAIEGYVIRSRFLANGSATQKITSALLMLFRRFGKEVRGQMIINLPLTHQDIADLAGVTRETVSILLGMLKKEGIISTKGKYLTILNSDQLSLKASENDDGSLLNLSF
ncbi:MAG: Transcriptional regulator, Crp/Fnr family [Candidatus Woesebacteria bacterium GW2011_GWB1_38_5]|uniref:Transcriptional regulator, Crp/Fnr family n=4 Tax=Candidatus Woeseibacteriota TaxID=1752722 RepID=A0A0G0KZL8_9BACT|nr:MAG: Transcriptional regulator, Crp/Fnr family [Candidatus Woesebacteria bacterium GW2011_GWD1_38_10]KKQ55521.1 MAG: Transcriptional regulator, Crp/Fnr family [Candidatus Woesebacteria bacterium GW2011_GWC1_38_13]KKQ75471.1 MAG: Transcriptional regulator, Crp/Fnr family [Candidatus Woesebacteria bacterium GW2011_GWB1_38_5]KKQ84182.1 MAG: Transcriptional regulator, Crp/Fnr family [Candidatus Woesebacteria bacterium GW2011_GWA1_38_8]